jgi:hypothetical protein
MYSVCRVFWLRKLATSPKPRISQYIKIKLMTYIPDITVVILRAVVRTNERPRMECVSTRKRLFPK